MVVETNKKNYRYSSVQIDEKGNESLSDIVERSIGTLGRWHLWVCFVIFLVKFPVAWHQLSIVFLAPPVSDFNCTDTTLEKCAANCTSHHFDRSVFTETIITEWDLVCERNQLANVTQLTFMFGILIGNVILGYLSDKYGRRIPLVAAVVVQVISGACAAFSPWFTLFLVFRFICAVATGGTMITSFVLVMELVGTKWRTAAGILYQVPFNLGQITLIGFSYLLRDWHHLQLIISLSSIILVSYYWVLPESPRWLLAVGRTEEATQVMEQAAKHNNLPTIQIRDDVRKYTEQMSNKTEHSGGNILDLVRTSNMRMKTFCICFNWIVCGLGFFGVTQYIGQIGGDIFINMLLSALIGLPPNFYIIYFMQKWGRRYCLIISNLITGFSCLVIALLPATPVWPTTLFGCLGILGLSTSFPVVYIYSGELYPTVVRNLGVGTSSMAARIGSMVAPFVANLVVVEVWLPPVIFGLIPLIGALLCLKLPETLNCKLPDTIEEAEQFGVKHNKVTAINDSAELENR